MSAQIETLFVHDDRDRLLSVNEPPFTKPAPYVFLGQTQDGVMWRFIAGLDDRLCSRLRECGFSRQWSSVHLDGEVSSGIQRRLENHGLSIGSVWYGPAYYLPTIDGLGSTVTVLIDHHNADLLLEHFPHIRSQLTHNAPCIGVVREGAAVSVCRTVRRSTRGAEAGVDTIESFRGRGYASVATRKWASMVWDLGIIPFYSTSSDNTASQRLAERAGFVHFGTDLHFSRDSP